MMKLKELTVHRFRGVAPGTRLVFDPGWNVLLGKNGAGKTTLLRLIAAVLSSDFSGFVSEEFQVEFRIALGVLEVWCNLRNVAVADDVVPDATDRLSARGSKELRASVRLTGAFPTINVEADRREVLVGGIPAPVRSFEAYGVIPSLLYAAFTHNRERANASKASPVPGMVDAVLAAYGNLECITRFDEAIGVFDALGTVEVPAGDRPLPPQLTLTGTGKRYAIGSTLFFSHELRALALKKFDSEHPDNIDVSHQELPFLQTAVDLFGFSSAKLTLHLGEKAVDEDSGRWSVTYGPLSFRFVMANGSIINHHQLSYGQKRMLAFLYYLSANRDVVVADELVNGLHHEWIRRCTGAIGDRQAFLTSQNPLLLDYLSFGSVEDAQARFIRCGSDQAGQWEWANLSPDQAERFFDAYTAGIQYVGEILRTENLW